MYVTAHRPGDPLGYMAPAVIVRAGDYWGALPGSEVNRDVRIGDYSSTCIDPSDGTFWAANEYYIRASDNTWGTWIQHFAAPSYTGTAPQLSSGDDQGSNRTKNELASITGSKPAGASVRLYNGTRLVGVYPADSSTTWSITAVQPLTVHSNVVAVVTTTAGDVSYSAILNIMVYARGDVNRDDHRSSADVDALEAALTDLNAYYAANSLSSTEALWILDINQDGNVTNDDIQALETLLSGGGGY
jgi:hypothetical protein